MALEAMWVFYDSKNECWFVYAKSYNNITWRLKCYFSDSLFWIMLRKEVWACDHLRLIKLLLLIKHLFEHLNVKGAFWELILVGTSVWMEKSLWILVGKIAALTNLCGLFFSVYLSVLWKYYYRIDFHRFPVVHRLNAGFVSHPLGSSF